MTRTLTTIAIVIALAGVGCKGKSKSNQKKASTEPPPVTQKQPIRPTTDTVPRPDIADQDLPVPSDFEAAAESEITEKNYKDQLSELQKELEPATK